jgi:hypothetical protein
MLKLKSSIFKNINMIKPPPTYPFLQFHILFFNFNFNFIFFFFFFPQASNGQWYEMNDSTVSVSNIKNVRLLQQQQKIIPSHSQLILFFKNKFKK